ncbi:hypothetical protein SB861_04955 [Paraburkholderia sp. SIMBA_049]
MDIIDLARESGLTVILDGRIGREEYHSVCGSISALSRFAESVCQYAAHPDDYAPCAMQRSPRFETSSVDGMSRTSAN